MMLLSGIISQTFAQSSKDQQSVFELQHNPFQRRFTFDLGKRDNVLVVREVNGERNFARINLLSKHLFNSPYYYLKTNDVVYVEPVKAKFVNRTGVPQYLSIVAVGLSLLITIINLRK